MPARHIGNAPRFQTHFAERAHYLRWAAETGRLKVDLKYYPPSNHGMVADLIKRGFLGKKQGASVPLTEKGRAFLKRHGLSAYSTTRILDLSVLDAQEAEVRALLIIALLDKNSVWNSKELPENVRDFIARGLVDMQPTKYFERVSLTATAAGLLVIEAAGDKMIRGIIAKTDDGFLRRHYAGLSDLLKAPVGATSE